MRAIVRGPDGARLAEVPEPAVRAGEVLIDVAFAGVCRTDLACADGSVRVAEGRVLGHELAGVVRAIGAAEGGDSEALAVGDPVTVVPFSPCRACAACAADRRCPVPRWLGVDVDGAFAERLRAPAGSIVRLPLGMPLWRGAYVEPVAAAMGVVPYVQRGARVLVCGQGRIAALTARIAALQGAVVEREDGAGEPAIYDVVIEHGGGDPAAMLARLAPGGTLVLKSRAPRRIEVDAGELVARDLAVRGASHGSFAAAIDLLHGGAIAVDDLLAPARPLEAFAEVFAAARAGEAQKQVFAISGRT